MASNEKAEVIHRADEERPEVSRARFSRELLLAMAIWIILAGVTGFWVGSNGTTMPGDGSAEAGFARDMSVHHANAVEMALLLADRTEDEEMRLLARDIMLTQQAQIGQMQGWLAVWRLPLTSLAPPMAWMGMPTEGLMPGMASAEEISRLRNLRATEADGVFLNLMIRHHQSGIDMARAILQRTNRPEVVSLAQAIVAAQESEIATMRQLLQRKGLSEEGSTSGTEHNSSQD